MRTDRREQGEIILAHGEITGHQHRIVDVATEIAPSLERAQYFEEPDGTRVLLVVGEAPVALVHQEHARLLLDPTQPTQARQGDVLLTPMGPGAWKVMRQVEHTPEAFHVVAD
jgi:hypothetical protein